MEKETKINNKATHCLCIFTEKIQMLMWWKKKWTHPCMCWYCASRYLNGLDGASGDGGGGEIPKHTWWTPLDIRRPDTRRDRTVRRFRRRKMQWRCGAAAATASRRMRVVRGAGGAGDGAGGGGCGFGHGGSDDGERWKLERGRMYRTDMWRRIQGVVLRTHELVPRTTLPQGVWESYGGPGCIWASDKKKQIPC